MRVAMVASIAAGTAAIGAALLEAQSALCLGDLRPIGWTEGFCLGNVKRRRLVAKSVSLWTRRPGPFLLPDGTKSCDSGHKDFRRE